MSTNIRTVSAAGTAQPFEEPRRQARPGIWLLAGFFLVASLGLTVNARAAIVDVYLDAVESDVTVPDGSVAGTAVVPVWKFVCGTPPATATNDACDDSTPVTRIDAAPGDDLTINVNNTLSVPVSVVIPGQAGAGDPEMFADVRSRDRARSLTHETGAGSAGTYQWNGLKAGTYLFQSGTYPQVQVAMGLHGALVVGPAALSSGSCGVAQSAAYDSAATCYDAEALVLFSEIDPVQNARVQAAADASAAFTTACVSMAQYLENPAAAGYPCTIDYTPIYLLVNGSATPTTAIPAGDPQDQVLVRYLNAGLRSHTPTILGRDMELLAEDGNLYPGQVAEQSAVLLAAGKTLDVRVDMPNEDVTFALFDRMPSFDNENQPVSATIARLQVGLGSGPADPDPNQFYIDVAVTEDSFVVIDPPGGNLYTVISAPANGTLVASAITGPDTLRYTYTPNPDFSGVDQFTVYREAPSNAANRGFYNYTLNVSFENDTPVPADDAYVNSVGGTLSVPAPGVLGNDSDVDGDALTAAISGAAPAGLTLGADGSIEYDGSAGTGLIEFDYVADDGSCAADPAPCTAHVSLSINPASGIALNVEDPSGTAVTAYRWLVQEDATYHVDPNAPPALADTLSLNFHKSYMPVIAQGCVGTGYCKALEPDPTDPSTLIEVDAVPFTLGQAALDPSKHYYVSVLPNDAGTGTGHTIGGAQIPPGATDVTVIVNNQEVPTAQISVLVFDDRSPTNGVPDADEPPLGGFQIVLEDAGGRYGISGGTMSQDAYGNPLTNALFGTPGCPGSSPTGVILTCPDGTALIQNLPPGKYGVIAVPPLGAEGSWIQTSTIEGTKVIDAWVKANEPPYFVEFGVAGPHAFIGFVNPETLTIPTEGVTGSNSFSGSVTLLHDPRPPAAPATVDSGSYDGLAHTRAWVGLNDVAGDGNNIATVHAAPDGSFSFTGIPDGSYQLVVWDDYLDQVIAFQTVDLPADAGDIGNVPVNAWFTRAEHNVFQDDNENGIRDPGEAPLQEQAINLRWRDGTVNQSFPTDTEGFVPFDQTFPFFSWQVFEVDYTRMKATGVTVTVDAGGPVDASNILAPQDGSPRTETGPVLTQGFQGFPGQTSIFEWGKKPYPPGQNGGISGIVFYGSTRGENDPRLTVGDPWEPGIPGVKVRLLREVARAGGGTALALVQEVETDSWDGALPEGCPGEDPADPFTTETLGYDGSAATEDRLTHCYDGWRNWNQVRPGVFDGGYAFNDIPPGKYVVEVVPPPGYELIKEEDVNVGFGDVFGGNAGTGFEPAPVVLPNGMLVIVVPDAAMVAAATGGAQPGLAQPPCVGSYHTVPQELSLFPGEAAPFAGAARPLCDRKEVVLSDQGQAAADFHLFTSTPVAAQFAGLITDDLSNEADPRSPGFGEKYSPAFLPFSIRDFNGKEVYRGYGDAFGRYNGMLPSTFTANVPIPSGYSPAMMSACLNDPGDGAALDPLVLPAYGTACYTAQFMPGTTTYLDTPVLPNSAFAGGYNPPDCSAPDGTPVIAVVNGLGTGGDTVGPWINATQSNKRLRIRSERNVRVPNPAYEGPLATGLAGQPTIVRDFGFGGTTGTVRVGDIELSVVSWNNNAILAQFPAGTGELTGQLSVTRGDNGQRSINAVTVTVSNEPVVTVAEGESIQAAIDTAPTGSLILVGPGTYAEMVVMSKPVRLQGSGSSTIINATKRPVDKLQAWQAKIDALFAGGEVDPLPGQDVTLATERGAGVTVLARSGGPDRFALWPSRIDGFTITGADSGGGIFVNGYATDLEISNNIVTGNSGLLHGGIRIGHPNLPLDGIGPFFHNVRVNVHHNMITRNGAVGEQATGGGVSIATGSNNYQLVSNFICGNFTQGDGAGIGHYGQSRSGDILSNVVAFNQSANASLTHSGGGIFIGGEPAQVPLDPAAPQEVLSLGSGSVVIDGNLILGNAAATGHGGGIRTQQVNGADVAASPTDETDWFRVLIQNNMIVNNVAAWSGAGISMLDTARAVIRANTIANNDSTATAGPLIDLVSNTSQPQPAGISVFGHSPALAAVLGTPGAFSDPLGFINNIIWHNRAFSYDGSAAGPASKLVPELAQADVGACDAGANYIDLGVIGAPGQLDPRRSLLSDTTGYHASNITGDPEFLNDYCNGARSLVTPGPMRAIDAVGEGGNFVDVRYGPLALSYPSGVNPWDYHIAVTGAAVDVTFGGPPVDYDGQARPDSSASNPVVDVGADEIVPGEVAFTGASLGTLAGGTLDFGDLTGNGAANDSTLTLSVSVAAVTFDTLSIIDHPGTPSGNPRFSIASDGCSGTTVAAGGSCTVTVHLRAGAGSNTTQWTGSLVVPHDGVGSPSTLALTGI